MTNDEDQEGTLFSHFAVHIILVTEFLIGMAVDLSSEEEELFVGRLGAAEQYGNIAWVQRRRSVDSRSLLYER